MENRVLSEATRLAACRFALGALKKLNPQERDQLFAWLDMFDRPDIQKLALGLVDKASRRQ